MENLEKICKQMRIDIIEMIAAAGSGHPGGSLSACDMIATLFFEKMNIDPSRPNWEDRDRFVLSKGHVAPALYAALAERGYIPREDLLSLRKIDSYLQGHPDMKHTNGVDMSTGSLGQGLSVANGTFPQAARPAAVPIISASAIPILKNRCGHTSLNFSDFVACPKSASRTTTFSLSFNSASVFP